MRKGIIFVILLAFSSWIFPANAQELPKMSLTIDDAVKIALKNSFPSRSAQWNYQSARWDLLGAWSGFLPSLDVSSGWTRSGKERLYQRLGQYLLSRDNYNFRMTLSQPIYNGGANFASYNYKRYGKTSAWDDLRVAEKFVTLSVKQGCYDLLKAQALYEVQVDAVGKSIEQLKMAKARYDLGAASLSDYLKARVQLGNDSLTLITNENNVKIAQSSLNSLLGLDVSTPIEINAQLEYRKLEADLEEETRTAVQKHPEIDKARMGVNQSHSSLTLARSGIFPTVSFFGDYFWSDIRFPSSSSEWNNFASWDIGINISINLFEGFLTTSKIKSAKAQLKLSQDNLEQKKRDIALAIKQAYLSVKEAEQKILVAQDALQSAEEDLKLTQEKYNLGAASILDLLSANLSYKTAKNSQVQSLYDYNLAVAQFEQASAR